MKDKDSPHDIDMADFAELLNNNEEIDVDYIDMKETIDEKDVGLKFEILDYWNHKPILRKYNQYICCLGSKRQLLLINTDFPDLEKHSHIRIKTDGKGNVSLSTVDYIFKCIAKKQMPKSSWTFICVLRLLADDDPYKEWLLFKKEKDKNKQKYINTHKR